MKRWQGRDKPWNGPADDTITELTQRAPFAKSFRASIGAKRTWAGLSRNCQALTEAGFLAVLIPEEYGGSGLGVRAASAILEEIHRSGSNGGACHAQMYIMGTVLRHGSEAQKQAYLPKIATGELRLQAFGVTEPTSGTDTLSLRTTAVKNGNGGYIVNGQKVWIADPAFRYDAVVGPHHPQGRGQERTDGLSVFLVDIREAVGVAGDRPIRTMINHATTAIFFDNLEIPADNLIGEEGKGFRYIPTG